MKFAVGDLAKIFCNCSREKRRKTVTCILIETKQIQNLPVIITDNTNFLGKTLFYFCLLNGEIVYFEDNHLKGIKDED